MAKLAVALTLLLVGATFAESSAKDTRSSKYLGRYKDGRLPLSPVDRRWRRQEDKVKTDDELQMKYIDTSSSRRNFNGDVRITDRIDKSEFHPQDFFSKLRTSRIPNQSIRINHISDSPFRGFTESRANVRSRTGNFSPIKDSNSLKLLTTQAYKTYNHFNNPSAEIATLQHNIENREDLLPAEQTFFQSMMNPFTNIFSENRGRNRKNRKCRSGLRCHRTRPAIPILKNENNNFGGHSNSLTLTHTPGLKLEGTIFHTDNPLLASDRPNFNNDDRTASHFRLINNFDQNESIDVFDMGKEKLHAHGGKDLQDQTSTEKIRIANNEIRYKAEEPTMFKYISNLNKRQAISQSIHKKRQNQHGIRLSATQATRNKAKELADLVTEMEHPVILTEPFHDEPPKFIRIPVKYSPNNPPPMLILKEFQPGQSKPGANNLKKSNLVHFPAPEITLNEGTLIPLKRGKNSNPWGFSAPRPEDIVWGAEKHKSTNLRKKRKQKNIVDSWRGGNYVTDNSGINSNEKFNKNVQPITDEGRANEEQKGSIFEPSTKDTFLKLLVDNKDIETSFKQAFRDSLTSGIWQKNFDHLSNKHPSGRQLNSVETSEQNNKSPIHFINRLPTPPHLIKQPFTTRKPFAGSSSIQNPFSAPESHTQFRPNPSIPQGFIPTLDFNDQFTNEITSGQSNGIIRLNPINLQDQNTNNQNNFRGKINPISQRSPLLRQSNIEEPRGPVSNIPARVTFPPDTRSPAERISSYTSLDAPVLRTLSIPNSHFVNSDSSFNEQTQFGSSVSSIQSSINNRNRGNNQENILRASEGRRNLINDLDDKEPSHITLQSPKFTLSVKFSPTGQQSEGFLPIQGMRPPRSSQNIDKTSGFRRQTIQQQLSQHNSINRNDHNLQQQRNRKKNINVEGSQFTRLNPISQLIQSPTTGHSTQQILEHHLLDVPSREFPFQAFSQLPKFTGQNRNVPKERQNLQNDRKRTSKFATSATQPRFYE